jgi:hypothetical protein
VFRGALKAAGVTRETDPELFPASVELKHREPVCAYDLRALFVTTSLAQGRTPDWIMRHTLHTTLAMLETYRRKSTHFSKHGPIVPAVQAIPELAAAFAVPNAAADAGPQGESSNPTTEKCTGGDSNPHASRRRNLNPLRLPFRHPCSFDHCTRLVAGAIRHARLGPVEGELQEAGDHPWTAGAADRPTSLDRVSFSLMLPGVVGRHLLCDAIGAGGVATVHLGRAARGPRTIHLQGRAGVLLLGHRSEVRE